MATRRVAEQPIGMTAMLALLGAISGMVMVFAGKPGWGLLLAACAAILGAIGFFISATPRINGGVMSIVAIVIAIFGIGLAVLGVIGDTIF